MELRRPVGCGCRWPDRGTVGRWGAAASRPASSRCPLHPAPSPRLPFPLGQLCAPVPCRRWLAQAGCLEPGLEPLPQLGRAPPFVGAERTDPLGGRGTACTMAGGSAPLAQLLVAAVAAFLLRSWRRGVGVHRGEGWGVHVWRLLCVEVW